jgi:hypothetical protein
MAGIDLLAALGGAMEGAAKGYSWQKEFKEDARQFDETNSTNKTKIAEQNEIARLKLEVQQMIAELNEGGRNTRHETPSGSVELQETGRNTRWATPSGNAILGSETTRRGQDMGSETTRRGQDLTFQTNDTRIKSTRENVLDTLRNSLTRAQMGAAVQERGQDISAESSRYGTTSANFRAALPKAPLFSFSTEAGGGVTAAPGAPAGGGGGRPEPPVAPSTTRPSVLDSLRGGGTTPAPAAPPRAARSAPAVNSIVTLRDGTKVMVTKVNPDGSIETRPIK